MSYTFWTMREYRAFLAENPSARLVAWPYSMRNTPWIVFVPNQQQRNR